jgi:hypothetical protein
MNITELIQIFENMEVPSAKDASLAIDQADSLEDLKNLCEVTEDGGGDGVFSDLHVHALRRFVEVAEPSDLDANAIAWMAGLYGNNVEAEKKEVFREACEKGKVFNQVFVGNDPDSLFFDGLTLSTEGDIVLICREGDWEVSIESILGNYSGIKSVVLPSAWDSEDSRLSAFLAKLSNGFLPDLEDITIIDVNNEMFEKWRGTLRNYNLFTGGKTPLILYIETDGDFIPPFGAVKVEGKKAWSLDDAAFLYEGETLERILEI